MHITEEYCHTMMDTLRASANHVAIKIILALIIMSLILTGIGNYLVSGFKDYAAKVNGQTIERDQLERFFQIKKNIMQQELGEQFYTLASNEGYMKQMRKQVLSQLIDNILLLQYAKKLDINVSNDQIKNAIRNIPYFQTDGIFDNAKYLNMLNNIGDTAADFAQSMREQLIIQQIIQALKKSSFILPNESQAMVNLVFQQRDVRLAIINTSALQSQQKVGEEEIKTYYKQHKNNFIIPHQIKINYIPLDLLSMTNKVKISDSDITAYYEQNKSSYTQPERKNYSVIQLKTETEAKAVLSEIKKGNDFFVLAKNKSTDIISRRTGGNLGWLEQKNTKNEIKQAHLTQKGQVSTVLKSSTGYLIVRLNDIEPEKVKPLSDVYKEIVQRVRREKSLDIYHAIQNKVKEAIIDNRSISFIEDIIGIKATQTDWITPDTIPKTLNFKPVVQLIFKNSQIDNHGISINNSNLITVDNNRSFVICITAYKEKSIKSFNQTKKSIVEIIKYNKAIKKAELQGKTILIELKKGTGDKVMQSVGLNFGAKKRIARTLDDNLLIKDIFSLPYLNSTKPIYGISHDPKKNVVLFVIDRVIPGELSPHEMKKFVNNMEQSIATTSIYSLLLSLRKDANINIRLI